MIEILDEERKPLFEHEELRNLCIKHGWFTAGTNEQYQKLFDLNEWGESVHDLALVIWLCSNRKSKHDVEQTLKAAAERPLKNEKD